MNETHTKYSRSTIRWNLLETFVESIYADRPYWVKVKKYKKLLYMKVTRRILFDEYTNYISKFGDIDNMYRSKHELLEGLICIMEGMEFKKSLTNMYDSYILLPESKKPPFR